ncbi:hypothetical protein HYH03_017857 [Edaphochlamys debaryana]|uniref:Uncharacterized protein n=1 Tax=Edaphochlamys debaryana TaxID=47281 RepID=A0A835XNC6_9CHLO|nr:hypothetical protein HYH03_017857 [Edaphochlamys debaryana]|eukprot:KAG2483259.1 hypothetical protein HYH03_017857 [Edaphochlamys debaryana]
MASAPAQGDGRDCILLRGPFVRGIMAAPPALRGWLQQVSADATGKRLERYFPLPSAGAVVLECTSCEGAKAVAAAARRLGEAVNKDGGGVALVEAVHSERSWQEYIVQVLQALWDGEGEGSAEAEAVGAEAAGGAAQSELERLRCLLETWEGLRAMPAAVKLEPLPAS